jgi:hypothetical protein
MRNSPETWNRNSLWWGWFGTRPFHTLTSAGKGGIGGKSRLRAIDRKSTAFTRNTNRLSTSSMGVIGNIQTLWPESTNQRV